MLAIVAVVAVLAGSYWNWVWQPAQDKITVLSMHADSLDAGNKIAKAEVDSGNAPKIRAQADLFAREWESDATSRAHGQSRCPGSLDAVSTAARQAGLDVSEFSPDGVVPGNGFDIYRFKLGVTGPYHQIAEFIANIGSLERIVEPINVVLAPSGRPPERRPRKDEALLDAHFDIQTYVAHASTPAPSPTPAKPK